MKKTTQEKIRSKRIEVKTMINNGDRSINIAKVCSVSMPTLRRYLEIYCPRQAQILKANGRAYQKIGVYHNGV